MYGAFLAVGAFFFAMARAYNPRLLIFSVFGTVTLDVMVVCTSFLSQRLRPTQSDDNTSLSELWPTLPLL